MGSWFKKHVSKPWSSAVRNPIKTLGIIATAPVSIPVLAASSLAEHYGQKRAADYLKVLTPGTVLTIKNPTIRRQAEIGYAAAAVGAASVAAGAATAASLASQAEQKAISMGINKVAADIVNAGATNQNSLASSPVYTPGYATEPSFDQGNPTYYYNQAAEPVSQASIFGDPTIFMIASVFVLILFGIFGSRKG